jgi:hypothetical protein
MGGLCSPRLANHSRIEQASEGQPRFHHRERYIGDIEYKSW